MQKSVISVRTQRWNAILCAAILAAGLCLAGETATAQTNPSPAPPPAIELVGGGSPVTLTLEELARLPQVEQEITFKTSKGMATARYKGPLLWDVLSAGKALEGLDGHAELTKTLMVTASDGYRIAFSVGELAPEFGNAMILLALETDGKPLADGFRIVAQGDKRGARAIHDIVTIEVR